jgi:HPt (histidine-containing phosphotransfer) domain-containing protein
MMKIDHGFQFDRALKRLGGDEELFQELATFFIEDAPGLIETIREGLHRGETRSVQRAAHSLKGLLANFDAEDAVATALSIELSIGTGNMEVIPGALETLQTEVQALEEALLPYKL